MRASKIEVFVHLVWATWDRLPLLGPAIREDVRRSIAASFRESGCLVVAVGGVEDHVHAVVGLPATVALAEVVRRAKGTSSHLVTHVLTPDSGFRWQGTYAAFSVSRENVDAVERYVRSQAAHHADDSVLPNLEIS